MDPSRHPDRTVGAFRVAETAQVWAEDRVTGEPRYIGRGQAAELREEAKAAWQCPVPGCSDARISTRGGSRRDHFFHLTDGAGHSDGESLQHLQAKAMLAAWAREQAPAARVEEERSIKDPVTRRTRRPDVLAEWPDGRRVGFEVEYKSWSVADWRAKQDDFDGHEPLTRAVWLFGHLPRYLAQPPRPADHDEADWDVVLIREIPQAVAGAGMPVLHVNPLDRTIGTVVIEDVSLAEARRWPLWYRAENLGLIGLRLPVDSDTRGRLVVCPLDECELDPELGLVTPVMREVRRVAAEIMAAAAEDRARDELAEQQRAAQRQAAERQAAAEQSTAQSRKAYALAAAERDAKAWTDHPFRLALIKHYGQVPPLLAKRLEDDRGVLGHHEHWHCVAFRDLVRGKIGKTWTVRQVYAVIAQSFKLHNEPHYRGPAITGFLNHLDDHELIAFDWHGGIVRVLNDDPNPAPPPAPPPPSPPPPRRQGPSAAELRTGRSIRLRMEAQRAQAAAQRATVADRGPRLFTVARLVEAGVDADAATALSEMGTAQVAPTSTRRSGKLG